MVYLEEYLIKVLVRKKNFLIVKLRGNYQDQISTLLTKIMKNRFSSL